MLSKVRISRFFWPPELSQKYVKVKAIQHDIQQVFLVKPDICLNICLLFGNTHDM